MKGVFVEIKYVGIKSHVMFTHKEVSDELNHMPFEHVGLRRSCFSFLLSYVEARNQHASGFERELFSSCSVGEKVLLLF